MTEEEIKKMGRPPVANPASAHIPAIRVTPEKLKAYKDKAESEGESLSQWVRDQLDSSIEGN